MEWGEVMNKKRWMIACLIGCTILSGCKKKQEQETKGDEKAQITVTATTAPTQVVSVTKTITPTAAPTPVIVGNHDNLLRFELQAITVPENFDTPFMSKDEFPVLDGSTANIPLAEAIYCHLTGASLQDAKNDLKFYKTPESYRRLMKGEADILFVYEPSQIILEEMKEQYAEFEFKPLGRDALVFIANDSNQVSSLTQQEITDIYTGKIRNWAKVGGKDQEILAFQRPSESGSQTLMEKLAVPASAIMRGPQVVTPAEMGDLIDVLASYNNASNALGYSVYFYANHMYSKPGLKFMAINGVMPTNESIQKGDYPYVNDFYVVIRKSEPEYTKARIIYNYMTTKEAQTILTKAGYVPVVDVNAKYPTVNKSVEISDILNLKKGQFLVEHNVSSEGVYEGDRILTKDYHEIVSFPSKYIDCGENLLLDSDLVLLKSYRTVVYADSEYTKFCYELYSISQRKYLTDHGYERVSRTLGGYYVFSNYDNQTDEVEEVIFSPKGKLICKVKSDVDEPAVLDVVKDRVVLVQDKVLRIYDKDGKQIRQVELPYDKITKAYINDLLGYRNEDYLWLQVNDSYFVIYNELGEPINDQMFLANLKVKKPKEPWIIKSIVATDGHLYVVGKIEDSLYILRDNGTILYESNKDSDHIYITLYANIFLIFDQISSQMFYMTLKGEILNPQGDYLPQTNDAFILQEEDQFTVYPFHSANSYVVKDELYDKESFFGSEGPTNLYMTWYSIINDIGHSVLRSNFNGVRTFDGYATVKEVGDYFILADDNYDVSKVKYEIIDKTGKAIFKAKENETITGVYFGEEIYVAIHSGNYEGIQDLNGNYIYRVYANSLSDD